VDGGIEQVVARNPNHVIMVGIRHGADSRLRLIVHRHANDPRVH
jgi:hypothetical protein